MIEEYHDEGPGTEDADLVDEPGGATPTAYCPLCGAEIYADADRCPACGRWITPQYHSPRTLPWKPIVAVILIVAFLLWYLLW